MRYLIAFGFCSITIFFTFVAIKSKLFLRRRPGMYVASVKGANIHLEKVK